MVGFTVLVEGVPDGERDAEEALPGDQPVAGQAAHPVLVAMTHVLGREFQLLAALQERGLQVVVAAAVADVPLAGGHDLERLVALLVEVGHAGGGLGITVEFAVLAQHGDGGLAGGERGLAGERLVGLGVVDPLGGLADEAPVAPDHRAGGQVELTPPHHVGEVAERAAHCDACALVGLGRRVCHHGDLDAEDGRGDGGAEQRLVPLVVRVGDERADADDQLGPRGLDVNRAIFAVEGDAVVGAGVVPRFQLGLRDGGGERHVPQRRRVGEVGLAPGEVSQECPLRHHL